MTKPLTERQQEVLTYIETYIGEYGFAPTVKEIADGVHLSKSSSHRYVGVLKDKGYITYNEGQARTIKVI